MASTTQIEKYCNFCGSESTRLQETRDGRAICLRCVGNIEIGFCEICGSTKAYYGQRSEEQLHFSDLCFK